MSTYKSADTMQLEAKLERARDRRAVAEPGSLNWHRCVADENRLVAALAEQREWDERHVRWNEEHRAAVRHTSQDLTVPASVNGDGR